MHEILVGSILLYGADVRKSQGVFKIVGNGTLTQSSRNVKKRQTKKYKASQ